MANSEKTDERFKEINQNTEVINSQIADLIDEYQKVSTKIEVTPQQTISLTEDNYNSLLAT